MPYQVTEPRLGVPNISSVSDAGAPEVKVGTIVRAEDPIYGAGEFIYLPCLSGQIVGSLVTYTMGSGVTPTSTAAVVLTASTKNQARPVAVSMAANTSGTTKYGWFALQGTVPVRKTAVRVAPNVAVFLGTTSGRIGPSSGSGKQVLGARTMNTATVASTTSTVLVQINRPHLQGQTT